MSFQDLFAAVALMLVIEGMLPFLNPGRFRGLLRRLDEMDDRMVRIGGFVSMMLGLVLLAIVR